MMKNRIERLFEYIAKEKKNVDCVLISRSTYPDINFFYFSNAKGGLFDGSFLILYPDGRSKLFTSTMEREAAEKSKGDFEIYVFSNRDERIKLLKDHINGQNLGLSFSSVTYFEVEKLKENYKGNLIDITKEINFTRAIKDREEIQNIKIASEITSKTFSEVPGMLKDGLTEKELSFMIEFQLKKNGAEALSYDTIAAFGANSSLPHYESSDSTLISGDFVLLDFAGKYNRYCSDMTRTFFYRKADQKQKRIYDTVLEAQILGIEKLRPGAIAKDVHNAVSSYIDNSEFKGKFIHSLGHGIGLETHDTLGISPISDYVIEKNMVFTIEPGVYIPDFGGVRIEDTVVVRNGKPKILTPFTKELLVI
ncbi:MAG: Xaa-Pro dipeptidase [Candidatus Methanofastidiosum methylothiophilum]|uniref:Xaa-Pro dipeptidase n=1 Tax=Candidatus Methanofastidiosum methylothiophilum TaxID=1705564 RepID=A0A150ITM8_9EURY|nr:MAG: Xaa-Pro dipeptidase [Candidatus Methanofastidiosum methylthiophilus]KYC48323.1 MAG: Xaa-Pro dipeptidase [Candidatus Methanofastidiosum methylthiophilus]KYC50992.1 MAG: Xaa-Pro dipeptidase [Candidatus Methanofastidiosum methylthiophilus]